MEQGPKLTDIASSQESETRDRILLELAQDPWLDKAIRNISKGSGLGDDLRSELFLVLGEKDPAYIVRAQEEKYLRYLVIKILQTMHESPRHPFYIRYRAKDPRVFRLDPDHDHEHGSEVAAQEYDLEETLDFYRREEALAQAEASADPVMRAIWDHYRKSGSAQEVARYFAVPYSYIRRRIREFKATVIANYQSNQK